MFSVPIERHRCNVIVVALLLLMPSVVLSESSLQALEGTFHLTAPKPSTAIPKAQCTADVLTYGQAKATGFTALAINNATSAQAVGQWFDAPGELVVSAVTFYAYDLADPPVGVTVTASIHLADANRLPTGPALASSDVLVNNPIGMGTLDDLRHTATLDPTVTVSQPFVVVIANRSPQSIGLMSNDYNASPADGLGEYLASVDIAGTWIRGDDVVVGGVPFDADWLLEPTVSYDNSPAFTALPSCLTGPDQVDFEAVAPFASSRFFNTAAFNGSADSSFSWDFGDGQVAASGASVSNNYASSGTYNVALTAAISLFNGGVCSETANATIGGLPQASFTFTRTGLTVDFTSMLVDADSVLWDFGDGNMSTQANPTHTYAIPGDYTACLSASNSAAGAGCESQGGLPPGTVQTCQNLEDVPVALQSFSID